MGENFCQAQLPIAICHKTFGFASTVMNGQWILYLYIRVIFDGKIGKNFFVGKLSSFIVKVWTYVHLIFYRFHH